MEETIQVRSPRTFVQLHQDAWSCVLHNPLIFLIIPAVIYFPFDFLTEYLSTRFGSGGNEVRLYWKISQLVSFFVGGYLCAYGIAAVMMLAEGQTLTPKAVLDRGIDFCATILGCYLITVKRTFLWFLLLIVPGIIKSLELALGAPAAIFEDSDASVALDRSKELMDGHKGRLFGYSLLAMLLYLPGAFGIVSLVPGESPLISAVTDIPFTIFSQLGTFGLALFYVDLAGVPDLARPVAALEEGRPVIGDVPSVSYSRRSVLLVAFLSGLLVLGGGFQMWNAPYFEGEKIVFGAADHELYYDPEIDSAVAQKIADVCATADWFDEPGTLFSRLDLGTRYYSLNVVVEEEYWQDALLLEQLTDLHRRLSEADTGMPVELVMYDDWQEKKRGFRPPSVPGGKED